ncbi:MAG TPA: N-acetylmuramoyl-L-alanine amidase [Dehalococcoidia bacterium]|nr:N-acetylmuramoyl-L-alanine amidase [Dehalococcoidia bacterium]
MTRWARSLLLLSMVAWTALTAAFGWSICQRHAARADPLVVYDVASPATPRSVHVLSLAEARATLPLMPTPEASPRKAPTSRPYVAPKYALDAGVGPQTRPVDAALPRAAPTAQPATKGVIVLDPGHGRGDPGAVHYLPDGSGRYDLTEADSNLENAELVRDILVQRGYTVYLTRNGAGQGPGAPLPLQFITSDLYARVALAKAVNADLYVAFHGNGATDHSISGVETWYCGKHESGAASEDLANGLQRAMMDALHEYGYFPPDRGIMEDAERHHSGEFCQFVVTREAPVPSALVEFLFLTNDADAKVLLDKHAHELMAQHVADAIDGFMQDRAGSR